MLLALAGNLYPVPEGPYGKLPYIYLAYLAAGLLWFAVGAGKRHSSSAKLSSLLAFRLCQQKQHDPDNGKQPERGLLPIPRF